MMGRTEPMKGGDEYDVFTSWRRYCTSTKRPGVCRAAKRKYNRRLRQKVRLEVREAS